jgi:hypothetical protein
MSREDDFDDIMDSDEIDAGQDDTSAPLLDLESVDESPADATEDLEAPEVSEPIPEVTPAPPRKPTPKKKKKAVAKPKAKAKKKTTKSARKPATKKVAKKKTTAKKKKAAGKAKRKR